MWNLANSIIVTVFKGHDSRPTQKTAQRSISSGGSLELDDL